MPESKYSIGGYAAKKISCLFHYKLKFFVGCLCVGSAQLMSDRGIDLDFPASVFTVI